MGTHEPDRQSPEYEALGDRPIVAFDFDGTLTTHDSFTAFLRWKAQPLGYALGLVRLLPHIVAYGVHRDRGRLKAAAAAVFLRGMTQEALAKQAEAFAMRFAQSMLRPDAVQAWRNWRAQGAFVVIVTASPEITIAPFARGLGADALIGTRLALDAAGRVTGKLDGRNCRGPEKVARLKQAFGQDMRLAAAYGDTSGDRDMIAIAETKGYRLFKAKP
jgi:phosphatidylglycerophosphatase C